MLARPRTAAHQPVGGVVVTAPSSAEVHEYGCFDFTLRSRIPLPELTGRAPDPARPRVAVVPAAVPETLPGVEQQTDHLQVAGDRALLTVPDVARFLITAGARVEFETLPGASARQLRLFLLGSALGVVAHQRGLLPLHANAIVAGTGAFAFCGSSGAGKSTLAAFFEQAGHALLSDDVCAIDMAGGREALAWPGIPRIKLWGDAARALGHDVALLDAVVERADKYHVASLRQASPGPVPLRRIYVLGDPQNDCARQFRRLRGQEAVAAVVANTYRGAYLHPLGLAPRHFAQCIELLRTVPVFAASRKWGYDVFVEELERIKAHMLDSEAA